VDGEENNTCEEHGNGQADQWQEFQGDQKAENAQGDKGNADFFHVRNVHGRSDNMLSMLNVIPLPPSFCPQYVSRLFRNVYINCGASLFYDMMDGDADAAETITTVFDHLPVGVMVLDDDGTVTCQNQAARDIAIGNPLTGRQLEQLRRGERLTSIQWQHGSRLYSIDGVPLPNGAALVIHDVTEQTAARRSLEEREEQFRLLTEHAPTGVAILRDGECLYVNATFASIAGRDISDDRFVDHVHPGDRVAVRRLLKKARTDIPEPCIVRLQTSTGLVWTECTATAITYQGEHALLVNLMDVTRHRQLEEEYHRSTRRMEQAMERERRFIEDVSHHFFNPLCIAKGYLNLSMRDADPEIQRKLQITREAVDRVETVVKNVVRDGKICE